MAWGKVDDGFYDHDKVLEIPAEIRNEACGLYWRAISYCNAKLTDGALTERTVDHLDGRQQVVDELLRVGLWNRRTSGVGFVIHDFGEFNRTRRAVEVERAAKAEAGRLGGIRSGEARRKQNGTTAEPTAKQPASISLNSESESESKRDTPPNPPRKRGGRGHASSRDPHYYDDLVKSDDDVAADLSFESTHGG